MFTGLTSEGTINYADLEDKLKEHSAAGRKCLVSLMHANNETGTLLDMERVGDLCKIHKTIFHSDCVQTIGHYPIELQKTGVHFASASGHKFHGPKGSGIYMLILRSKYILSFMEERRNEICGPAQKTFMELLDLGRRWN